MDRGAWQAVVHGVKSWTRLNSCINTLELVLLYKTHTHKHVYIYAFGVGGVKPKKFLRNEAWYI